jgi:hypothetical protein
MSVLNNNQTSTGTWQQPGDESHARMAAPSAIPEEWTEPEDVCLGKIFAVSDIQRPAAKPESPSHRRLQRGTQHLLVSKLFVCLVALLCIQPLATQPERKDDRVPSCAGSAVLRHGHHLRGTVHHSQIVCYSASL